MNGNELLQLIAIGAIAGAFGQGLRAIVGIKKASEDAAAQGSSLRDEGLDVGRLVFSLFIGAIAGGVGIFTITGFKAGVTEAITPEIFFGAIGIGYAGTDFIEGFVRTKLPRSPTGVTPAAANDRTHSGGGVGGPVATSADGTPTRSASTAAMQTSPMPSAGQGTASVATPSSGQLDAVDRAHLQTPLPNVLGTQTAPS